MALPILLLGAIAVKAQNSNVILYETRLETKKIPVVVSESVQRDFPNAKITESVSVPAKLYEQKWVVVDQNQHPENMDYIEVNLSGKNMHSTAIYTTQGKLVSSREVLKKAQLPETVRQAIKTRYPDWKDRRDKEVIKNGKHEITHYIVFLKKGWHEERVVFDPNGKVLHRFEI